MNKQWYILYPASKICWLLIGWELVTWPEIFDLFLESTIWEYYFGLLFGSWKKNVNFFFWIESFFLFKS